MARFESTRPPLRGLCELLVPNRQRPLECIRFCIKSRIKLCAEMCVVASGSSPLDAPPSLRNEPATAAPVGQLVTKVDFHEQTSAGLRVSYWPRSTNSAHLISQGRQRLAITNGVANSF